MTAAAIGCGGGPKEIVIMRRPVLIAGGIAAGALLLGAASPALAAGVANVTQDVVTPTCTAAGPDGSMPYGFGMRGRFNGTTPNGTTTAPNGTTAPGSGMGMMGGRGPGGMGGAMNPGAGVATLPKGTLTADQQAALRGMAEEEKLAHDVYVALAAKYPTAYQFSRIAQAEQVHLDAVRALLTKYGLSDPTAGKAAGSFASEKIQGMYDSFVKAATVEAAYKAGQDIEKDDIAALAAAGKGVTAQDVTAVYANLARASQMHLRAFGG